MHLEIIFKDPNRKKIIFIQNKNVMRGHPFLPSADLVLPAVRSASFSASPAPAVE